MSNEQPCRPWVFPKWDMAALARETAREHCDNDPSLDYEATRQELLARLEAIQRDSKPGRFDGLMPLTSSSTPE